MIRAEMEQILTLYRKGIVRPQVDKAFTFEQAGEAHRYLEQGKNLGKVVLIPDELPERPKALKRPGFPQLSPTRLMSSSSRSDRSRAPRKLRVAGLAMSAEDLVAVPTPASDLARPV